MCIRDRGRQYWTGLAVALLVVLLAVAAGSAMSQDTTMPMAGVVEAGHDAVGRIVQRMEQRFSNSG
eukprot:8370838-Prorocentrum_lima.AAC.1